MQTDRDDTHMAEVLAFKCAHAVPDAVLPPVAAACLSQSLKNLCFAIGGTHVAGWIEEAEMAAREGRVVKYE